MTSAGLDWAREKWKFGVGSKFIRQGEKNAVKYADEIIVLSKGVQKYFMETYGRETHFIPNGVNRPEVREAKLITDHFGLEKDSYILFLGRLVPEKGIRYLVEAFKNVKTDKKMVIAGGSSDTDSFMEELKELAKGDDRILFTGFVQGAMLGELYSNAYIYTLPSDLEGMPLSLLEAMSYGNCCLVSDIPECAEVVEDKALIFKKSDVKDLQEKLQDACDHPEMVMKMKNQAADFICEKYNWDVPLSVLEAASCNLPIVTTEYGELTAFREQEGFLFIDALDSDSLNQALEKALLKTEVNNRQAVLEYDWKNSIDNLQRIIRSFMTSSHREIFCATLIRMRRYAHDVAAPWSVSAGRKSVPNWRSFRRRSAS